MNNETARAKACVSLGLIQAHLETLESLPYRSIDADQLDRFGVAARALKRAAEHLVTEIENMEAI